MNKLMDLIDKALAAIQGVVSKHQGAMDMIEGLVQNIADLLDLLCDGELTCASKSSTYETCHGAKKRGRDAAHDKTDQFPVNHHLHSHLLLVMLKMVILLVLT